jgi:hypothetical protein
MRLLSCVLFVLSLGAVVAADEFKLEPGYKLIFNGKNLDGWQTKGAKPESLDGKTAAYGDRIRVADGQIVIDYKTKGDKYIETKEQFGGNFTIRFDFKPGEGCNNDLLLLGTKFDIRAGAKGGLKGVKLDDWNTMEILVKGGSAEFKVNGEKAATQKTKGDKGAFTLRAVFGPIAVKNVRVSEGK